MRLLSLFLSVTFVALNCLASPILAWDSSPDKKSGAHILAPDGINLLSLFKPLKEQLLHIQLHKDEEGPKSKDIPELDFMFETGDLLFTQLGTAENAISAVTEGYHGGRVNHMGVLIRNTEGVFVLEAFYPVVTLTPVEVFIGRSRDLEGRPRFMVGRLKSKHTQLIQPAVEYGLRQRNIPYDQLYLTNEDALYCSELVVDMFKFANGGKEFFHERPMSFRDTATGAIYPAWIEYYARFGMKVPQGEPGSNPGDISKNEELSILHVQGNISGLAGEQ